jgi:hypothetical protein
MKAECAGVELFCPLGIGGDGGYMVNATNCAQGWLRFHWQRFRTFVPKRQSEMATVGSIPLGDPTLADQASALSVICYGAMVAIWAVLHFTFSK